MVRNRAMSSALRTFMNMRRAAKGSKEWNITGMSTEDIGIYNISNEDYPEFLRLHHDHVFVHSQPSSYLEKHTSCSPILIDLDFRYNVTTSDREFGKEHIYKFVHAYTMAFFKFIDYKKSLRFFVELKPAPTIEDGIKKDGIHIICPDINVDYIVPFALRKYLLEEAVLKCFPSFTNTHDNCFDESVIQRNNWFLHGATKPDKERYNVVYCFIADSDGNFEETKWDESNYEMTTLFSIRHERNILSTYKIKEDVQEEWNTWVATADSKTKKRNLITNTIVYDTKDIKTTTTDPDIASIVSCSTVSTLMSTYKSIPRLTNEQIKLILDSLKEDRCNSYNDWIRCGMLLKNEQYDFELWDDWSKISPKYKIGETNDIWNKFKKVSNPVGIGTLLMWLKEDNIKVWHSLIRTHLGHDPLNSNSDIDIARLFAYFSKERYVYSDSDQWYYLRTDNLWCRCKNMLPPFMASDIHDTLMPVFQTVHEGLRSYLSTLLSAQEDNDADIARTKTKIDKYTCAIKAIKLATKSKNCAVFLKNEFYREKFEQLLDSNKHLLSFKNGVYDFNTMTFRPRLASDFITLTTNYNYNHTPNKTSIDEVNAFIYSCFESDEMATYIKNILASLFFGYNRFEKFYILTGEGANGKGTLNTLLRAIFGEYYISINVGNFTNLPKGTQTADPEIAACNNKRVVMTTEPESNVKLQVSRIKQYTGGDDDVRARNLFGDSFQYEIQFLLFVQTNDIPKLSGVDGGVIRRLRIIPFPFQFKSIIEKETDRIGDVNIKFVKCKSDEWRDAFLYILINQFKLIRDAPEFPCPEICKQLSASHITDSNPLSDWFFEFFEIDKSCETKYTLRVLKEHYESDTGKKVSLCDKDFATALKSLNILTKIQHKQNIYFGILRK